MKTFCYSCNTKELGSESWHNWSYVPFPRSPAVAQNKTRSLGNFSWSGSVLSVLPWHCRMGDRNGIWLIKKPVPLIHKDSPSEQVEDENRADLGSLAMAADRREYAQVHTWLIDSVKVLHPTQHKIGHFGDVPQANLLAWYRKTKTNTTKAHIHQSK